MSIHIILKSGTEFIIKCKSFTLNKNGFEVIFGYEVTGITENKPLYLNWSEVAAVIHVMSDEDKYPDF